MKKSLPLVAIIALITTLLTACGGSSSRSAADTSTSAADTATTADAFTTSVGSTVSASADNTEPDAIDSMTASAPDDTGPMPII